MSLTFDFDINLSSDEVNSEPNIVKQPVVISETDSKLRIYYINDNLTADKDSNLVNAEYANIYFDSINKHLTVRAVDKIGIKTFPGLGSYGFFKYKYSGLSMIFAPINSNRRKFTSPTISMSFDMNKILFSIEQPKDITYTCFRIELRNGDFAIEYITYEQTLSIDIPKVKGKYFITCTGYVNEGAYISHESNLLMYTVTVGEDSFMPPANISYYTRQQVEDLIAASIKTYVGDQETIDVNQDTGVITVNTEYRTKIENTDTDTIK